MRARRDPQAEAPLRADKRVPCGRVAALICDRAATP